MKPILYSYFRSSAAYRVRIALNLKNISYDMKYIHLLKNGGEQNQTEFTRLNPMQQVPFFIDGDVQIAQSMAIIDYIDQKWHDGIKLFPHNKADRARVMEYCELINSGVQPLIGLEMGKQLVKQFRISEEQKKSWMQFWIQKGFHALEIRLQDTAGNYCSGNHITAADCFLMPQIFGALRNDVDLSIYPNILRIHKNLTAVDAFAKAHPDQQLDKE
jgi:maleylacetoacetate isomerase